MLPFVSIIIPVFKVRDYIEECVASVIAQDYTGPLECILIDDCGNDGSIEIAEQYLSEHPSKVTFSILHHDRNRKQSAGRNTGMAAAKGDYISFLDSDDWLEPNAISEMVNALAKHPDCQLVQAGIICTDPNYVQWLDHHSWKDANATYVDDRQWIIDTCSARLGMIPMTVPSKLYRKDFLERNNFRFVEGIFHEDEVWLALLAKYLENVSFVHKNLYNYRLCLNSTTAGGKKIHFEDWKSAWLEIFKLFDKQFCPKSMLKQIYMDTSYFFTKTEDRKNHLMLIGIKLRLMRYANWDLRLRIIKWVLLHLHKI